MLLYLEIRPLTVMNLKDDYCQAWWPIPPASCEAKAGGFGVIQDHLGYRMRPCLIYTPLRKGKLKMKPKCNLTVPL